MRRVGRMAPWIALLLGALAPHAARGQEAPRLVASGCSVSNVGYLSELAADYERITGVRMFVRGGGSVVGLEDLAAGTVDFAAACRGKETDDPADLEFVQLAWDALVFVVHPANPLDGITLADARAIYRGELRDWSRLGGNPGPIRVFLQRPSRGLSGVESSLRQQVLQGRLPAAGPNVTELASTGIVEQLVEKTPGGFAAAGFSSARRRALKMLALEKVPPRREAIIDGSYPLRRPLYLIVRKPTPPPVKEFIDFSLSPRGQALISSYGAVSLREVR